LNSLDSTMKFSTGAILLVSLSTASAFVQPTRRATFSRRFVVSEPAKTEEAENVVDAVVVAAEPVAAAAAAAEPAVAVAEPAVVAVAEPAAAVAEPAAAAVAEPESVLKQDSSLVP
jgi:hypothetical protein